MIHPSRVYRKHSRFVLHPQNLHPFVFSLVLQTANTRGKEGRGEGIFFAHDGEQCKTLRGGSGLAKNSGCLAFLNPGGRLADLISGILEAQEGSLRLVSGSIDALSLLCASSLVV